RPLRIGTARRGSRGRPRDRPQLGRHEALRRCTSAVRRRQAKDLRAERAPRLSATQMTELDELNISVANRPEEHRYELLVAGEHAGAIAYRDRGGTVAAFRSTDVAPNQQPPGLGSPLVSAACEAARGR